MNIRIALAAALLAAAAAPGPAAALTCYFVIDRNDNVVYRDLYPPVDLSDQGAAERERLRRRGDHLVSMESDRCPSVEFFTGSAGSPTLAVDQVVAGMPIGKSEAAAGAASPSARGGAAAPKAAPAQPATPRNRK
jgi:hypothetical protein